MRYLTILNVWMMLGILAQITMAQNVTFPQDGTEKIDQLLGEAVHQGEVPAVEAIVVGKESVLYHNVFGKRNAAENIDLQKKDLFDIASMTKPITATAVMILYEEGMLELDDPVSKFFPAFDDLEVMTSFSIEDTTYTSIPQNNPITIRHLLSHTSGMGYPWFHEPLLLLYRKMGGTGFVFEYDYMQLPLLYQPGTGWSYGISAQVLGKLVEQVSGQGLDKFFEERIFEPLGMDNTFYRIPESKLDRSVTLQVRDNGEWTEQALSEVHEGLVIGDATLISTGWDYARFAQMMLNGGELNGVKILSKNSVELMTQNQIGDLAVQELFNEFPAGAGRDKFGFGFQITSATSEDSYRPNGSFGWAGSNNTYFWVDPVNEIAAVVLMHYLPFHDETAQSVYESFEKCVYNSLR